MNTRILSLSIAIALAIAVGSCASEDAQSSENQAASNQAGSNGAGSNQAGSNEAWTGPDTGMASGDGGWAPYGDGDGNNNAGSAARQGTQQVEIADAAGFGQSIAAATMQIPADWRTQGGVAWDRSTNCISNQLRIQWAAASPDGSERFEIIPGYNWQVQGTQIQMNPCPVLPINSTQAFLQAVVQQRRSGARVLEYRDRPDLAQQAAQAAANQGQGNPQARLRHDAGQILIAYQQGGQDIREVLGTTVTFSQMGGNVVGGAGMVFAHRAPNGKLDFGRGDRIAASMKFNPQWLTMMSRSTGDAETRFSSNQRNEIEQWHQGEMQRINAKGAADRAAIRTQTNRDVAQIYSDTNANTQATNDGIHQNTLEGIGEYNTYNDPATGNTVQSSIHGGDRVLRTDDGSYISTDDPYYNPAGSTELEREP